MESKKEKKRINSHVDGDGIHKEDLGRGAHEETARRDVGRRTRK